MKLPDIKGINKIRDFKICSLWIEDGLTIEKIAEDVGLTERRIRQILRTNSVFLKVDKDFEKAKRIVWIKRQIIKRGDTRKDSADLQLQLKNEIEGDRPLVSIEKHTHLTIVQQIREVLENGNGEVDRSRITEHTQSLSAKP